MHPVPCSHCGYNFMRSSTDPEAPKLCNSCLLRETTRNPKKKAIMEKNIDIKITCPLSVHNEIEEYCLNNGIDLNKYFLSLHDSFKMSFDFENNSDQKSDVIIEKSESESKSNSKSKKK